MESGNRLSFGIAVSLSGGLHSVNRVSVLAVNSWIGVIVWCVYITIRFCLCSQNCHACLVCSGISTVIQYIDCRVETNESLIMHMHLPPNQVSWTNEITHFAFWRLSNLNISVQCDETVSCLIWSPLLLLNHPFLLACSFCTIIRASVLR